MRSDTSHFCIPGQGLKSLPIKATGGSLIVKPANILSIALWKERSDILEECGLTGWDTVSRHAT